MRGYSKTLRGHANEIVQSYNTVCANIRELGLRRKGTLINRVQNDLTIENIDYKPRLIIFGNNAKASKSWEKHRQKLKNKFKGRLIVKGC